MLRQFVPSRNRREKTRAERVFQLVERPRGTLVSLRTLCAGDVHSMPVHGPLAQWGEGD